MGEKRREKQDVGISIGLLEVESEKGLRKAGQREGLSLSEGEGK